VDRGMYTHQDVEKLHAYMQAETGNLIDHIYYSPHHNTVSRSILSKPNPAMLEKGIAKYGLDPSRCWLMGDAERDLQAAHSLGIRAILIPTHKEQTSQLATHLCVSLLEAAVVILEADQVEKHHRGI